MNLRIVDSGNAKRGRPAVLDGEGVRILVDCRETFGNPGPIAEKIASLGLYEWCSVKKQLPDIGKPIEMTGSSGYVAPNDRFVVSGYYDPEYRPRSPWLDSTSTCIEDAGWIPTHWRYLTPGPELTECGNCGGVGFSSLFAVGRIACMWCEGTGKL